MRRTTERGGTRCVASGPGENTERNAAAARCGCPASRKKAASIAIDEAVRGLSAQL